MANPQNDEFFPQVPKSPTQTGFINVKNKMSKIKLLGTFNEASPLKKIAME
jgi:hypothetical protein